MRLMARVVVFLLLAFSARAEAVPQLLTFAVAKASAAPPKAVKSVAQPVRFNAATLRTLKPGAEVELTLPDASRHTFVFDVGRDHGQGIYSWVGYYRDRDERRKLRAVITTGPDGSFGSIQTPAGEWRLLPGKGNDWLVDMAVEQKLHEPVDLAADAVPSPRVRAKGLKHELLGQAEFVQPVEGLTVPKSAKVLQTPSMVTVDVLFVYTAGLAAQLPGAQLQTRLAQLVTSANTAYSDSRVGITLRIAGTTMVSYPDDSSDAMALNDITYASSPAFASIAKARDDAGADVVSLLRAGSGFGGSGIAWLPSHAITGDDAYLMYSVVTGCTQGCDWVWIHELGHNMGNAHDRATVAWEVAGLKQPESHGSYDYSYGFYTCNGAIDNTALSCPAFGGGCTQGEPQCKVADPSRDFVDIMGYFHGSTRVMQFSNPDQPCAGSSIPCGFNDGYLDGTRPASSNAALSMNNNRVALSALRSVNTARSQGATAVSLGSSANPSREGSPLTLNATVTSFTDGGQSAVGEGAVQFRVNGELVAGCESVPVNAGQASCTALLASGTYSVTGAYTGTASYPPSPATAMTQEVAPLPAVVTRATRGADLDGNGRADLAWTGPNAVTGVWLMAGTTVATAAQLAAPSGTALRALADFDGDGRDDALWRGADGSYWISLLDGASVRSTVRIFGGGDGWDVVAVGDFDGDKRADLLWGAADGRYGTWLMNGTGAIGYGTVAVPADAKLSLLGDFDGDGVADLVWRMGDGAIAMTLMARGSTGALQTVMAGGSGWAATHVGDFDGDGRSDLLLAHPDGRVAGWTMNGAVVTRGAYLVDAGSGWSVARVAVLDGDGKSDIVWCHAADNVSGAWLMDGLAARAAGSLNGTPGNGWLVAATGDFNGDGRADVVFRKATGEHAIWLMSGLQPLETRTVLGPASGWRLAP